MERNQCVATEALLAEILADPGAHSDQTVMLARALVEERKLLDLLDKEANAEPIVLHNLRVLHGGYRGLGLQCTGRSLRQALRQWLSAGYSP